MSKLTPDQAKALRAAMRPRSRRDLKAAFALIRAADDRALLAVLAPAKKRAKRAPDRSRAIWKTR